MFLFLKLELYKISTTEVRKLQCNRRKKKTKTGFVRRARYYRTPYNAQGQFTEPHSETAQPVLCGHL